MLGFPQPEKDQHEEETIHGRTNCLHSPGCGNQHDRHSSATAWGFGTIHLSVETAVWPDGGRGCAGTLAVTAGECATEEGFS